MNLILAEEVLCHIHNWFVRDTSLFSGVTFGSNALPSEIASYVPEGTYYRIQGTYLNDGLHLRGTNDVIKQEDVDGPVRVSKLVIPNPLLAIIDEIADWEDKYGEVAKGPFFSESFGGYEYEIRGYSSYGAASSSMSGWRLAFANRLNPFRRMY